MAQQANVFVLNYTWILQIACRVTAKLVGVELQFAADLQSSHSICRAPAKLEVVSESSTILKGCCLQTVLHPHFSEILHPSSWITGACDNVTFS